eukprot:scaffold1507_cov246-Prasinococcus_capsulatus_cf.AAC.3
MPVVLLECDGVVAEVHLEGHRVAFNRALDATGINWNMRSCDYMSCLRASTTGTGVGFLTAYFGYKGWPQEAGATQEERERFMHALLALKDFAFEALVAAGELKLRDGVAEFIREAHELGCQVGLLGSTASPPESRVGERVAEQIQRELGIQVQVFDSANAEQLVRRARGEPGPLPESGGSDDDDDKTNDAADAAAERQEQEQEQEVEEPEAFTEAAAITQFQQQSALAAAPSSALVGAATSVAAATTTATTIPTGTGGGSSSGRRRRTPHGARRASSRGSSRRSLTSKRSGAPGQPLPPAPAASSIATGESKSGGGRRGDTRSGSGDGHGGDGRTKEQIERDASALEGLSLAELFEREQRNRKRQMAMQQLRHARGSPPGAGSDPIIIDPNLGMPDKVNTPRPPCMPARASAAPSR